MGVRLVDFSHFTLLCVKMNQNLFDTVADIFFITVHPVSGIELAQAGPSLIFA